MAAGEWSIRTDRLAKRYGERIALEDASIAVPHGAIAGLIGPNGAGKTTLVRILLGLARPTSGSAEVLGAPLSAPARFLHEVGAVVETPTFYPGLSARRNLEVLCTLGGIGREHVAEVLGMVGLHGRAEEAVRGFSLGMRQRLAIGAALLCRPKLLILDEPLNGLDPDGIREVRELLRTLSKRGATVLVSTHLLGEVEQVATWLIFVRGGRVRYCGPAETLLDETATDQLVVAVQHAADIPRLCQIVAADGLSAAVEGERVRVRAPFTYAARLNSAAMRQGIVLVEIVPVRRSLEQSYTDLMEGE
jgi:ABC-2 type transport system ATP-binding protein